jgi:hypothetical protein
MSLLSIGQILSLIAFNKKAFLPGSYVSDRSVHCSLKAMNVFSRMEWSNRHA